MNKSERRMQDYLTGDRQPRTPYCTGCGAVFKKRHLLINHRNSHRCGGRFLPEDERSHYDKAKVYEQEMLAADKANDVYKHKLYWTNWRDQLTRAYALRKVRMECK